MTTGIRISPGNPFNDIVEHDVAEIYGALVPALGRLELAYLHLTHGADEDLAWAIRRDWPSALLLNRPGADIRVRAQDVRGGLTDVITVSSMTLANPDLVERIKVGAPLNTPDPSTFYGGDERGYTDYPTLQPAIA
jgi:N-ethylmaleimide reductase